MLGFLQCTEVEECKMVLGAATQMEIQWVHVLIMNRSDQLTDVDGLWE